MGKKPLGASSELHRLVNVTQHINKTSCGESKHVLFEKFIQVTLILHDFV
jgi:hypothetical protein